MASHTENSMVKSLEPAKDKRGLGIFLISVSSILSMVIIGVIAVQLAQTIAGDNSDMNASDFEKFSTAAGSEIPDLSTKK